jgi:uncharacterized repeat protein (TIGR02543 family)/LPXTG-motif cell wall-anchored protein
MSRRPISAVAIVAVSAWLVLGLVPAASAAVVTTVSNGITYSADDTNIAAGATVMGYSSGSLDIVIPSTVMINSQTYTVTTVADFAFATLFITSLVLPPTLTNIGQYAFLNNMATSLVIPDSVTTLGSGAFALDQQLTSLSIGTGITAIPYRAFTFDSALTSVVIPPQITSIGQEAFYRDALTSVDIQGPVTIIGKDAFSNNDLTSFTFPASVTSIDLAFANNPLLTSFTFTGPPPTTFHAAGGPGSLDSGAAITVNYLWANDAAQTPGGFTSPTWQGYNTQELVTTTFDLNGHGAAIDPQRISDGDAPTAPVAPTATQWVFNGWYTDAALTTPANFTDPLTADQTLFARWDPTLAATGATINYGALWAGAVAVSLGALLLLWTRRRRAS